jgi:hypothetical protein
MGGANFMWLCGVYVAVAFSKTRIALGRISIFMARSGRRGRWFESSPHAGERGTRPGTALPESSHLDQKVRVSG